MPLRQIILHIGRHKSGTSSLQHCLAGNRDVLDAQGVLYPRSGTNNRIAHHQLAQAVNPRRSAPQELEQIANAIKAELKPHHDRLLLSSEAFQNVLDLSRVGNFVRAFGPAEVHVVVYMREHLDYAVSSFRQMVQNQPKFSTFADHAHGFRDMGAFLDRWALIGTLTAKWFDRKAFRGGDVISDFCAETGITVDSVPGRDMNPSLGGNLLAYKLAANKLALPSLSYNQLRSLAEAHEPFRAAFYISDSDAARLRANHNYNTTLFARLGETAQKSFATHKPLPDLATLEEDLDRIAETAPLDTRLRDEIAASSDWFRALP